MTDELAGFRFWAVGFDDRGDPLGDGGSRLVSELARTGIRDLFVFSHGWNNDAGLARRLYEEFFENVADFVGDSSDRIGLAGVFWPSMRWPDETLPLTREGGAAGLPGDGSGDELTALRAAFADPGKGAALDEAARLLDERPEDHAALERFHELLRVLAQEPDVEDAPEDAGEAVLVESPAEAVFDETADLVPADAVGGAQGFGDTFGRLWNGAKQALRQTTYWTMKKRAGVVGMNGLAPLIEQLTSEDDAPRIHLVGHSFGARLVSYAVRGLSDTALAGGSPVKSLTLIQGAFSHFAFAPTLPHDPARSGGLAGTSQRVDGPILVTHSRFDEAVGNLYPWASIVGRDDSSAIEDKLYRWGAMGHDGAQASDATEAALATPLHDYGFQDRRIHNLDGNQVIVYGDPPSGAHSDIFHPELAWAVVNAARLG